MNMQPTNIYLHLTEKFNAGRFRAIISSGQAVVLHQLAIMSKDGDWILREDEETFAHLLTVLDTFGARYRFGAPLDIRWMKGGWSSHYEFIQDDLRVRTDFVTRPPRISRKRLAELWRELEQRAIPFVDAADLIEFKKTNREKDYAIIGELARLLTNVDDQLRYSRSARDIIDLCESHPQIASRIAQERPLLLAAEKGISSLEAALDAERRGLIHENERRLKKYLDAAKEWAENWKLVEREIVGMPLVRAHRIVVERAEKLLPFNPAGAASE